MHPLKDTHWCRQQLLGTGACTSGGSRGVHWFL